MATTNALCGDASPALLLVEQDAVGHSEVAEQFNGLHYRVTRADNPRDIFLMRRAFSFPIAVLSDTVGSFALCASAQVIREQWPDTRILILGKTPSQLEDHLYDEAVLHWADQVRLILTIESCLKILGIKEDMMLTRVGW